jgi:multiple sugar transport system substrate-binding protein
MTNVRLKGLSWGHRRATAPLEALSERFRQTHSGVIIDWVVRPLSDFEHQPIADIAGRYDLLVIDHPFCGDIASSGAFVPLEGVLPRELGPAADKLYVGASLASYRFGGHVWAAPIDAAAPHAAYRADLLRRVDEPVPSSWDDTLTLAHRLKSYGLWVATPVKSPHAYATVASLMANLGRPIVLDSGGSTIDRSAMSTALEALMSLVSRSPEQARDWNAIDISEAMVARDDIAFTPCVYGYATYAESDMRAPLRFADFCGVASPFFKGAMLGGTGLAVSASSNSQDIAIEFVRFCLSSEAQDRLIPHHHGQPALETAWRDAENNETFGGYYTSVRRSIENSWIRPRRSSYIRFQSKAGYAVEQYCKRQKTKSETIEGVIKLAEEIDALREARNGSVQA